jgi:3-oxoacyl-[acyl-carrier protein] reductase
MVREEENMDLGLKDKVALVTAASRGLGAAVAHRFALEGAQVAVCARDLAHAQAMVERIRADTAAGSQVLGFKADVTLPGDVDTLVWQTIERLGRIDILIVNAGGPPAGTFDTLKPEDWEKAAQLTLMSAVRLCYATLPYMKQQGSGSIVFITAFLVKQPTANLILSNSLRLATIGLMKSLSQEMASFGIRVNAVAPGWTATERVDEIMQARAKNNNTSREQEAAKVVAEIPMGRMGRPEEFANATVFLASPAASYITGVTLPIDGGITRASL